MRHASDGTGLDQREDAMTHTTRKIDTPQMCITPPVIYTTLYRLVAAKS